MPRTYYESPRALSEYLLFHYGGKKEIMAPTMVEAGALHFPVRCVAECLETARLPAEARGLDLGCAVGRSTFELARWCAEVVGVDYSQAFIDAARRLARNGWLDYQCVEEGELVRPCRAEVPAGIDRGRACFVQGDAMNLPKSLGTFDVVLMANLLDRLNDPRKCLKHLPELLRQGGQAIITSPYTWLREYTPRMNWLGGFARRGKAVKSFDTLKQLLEPEFKLLRRRDLPFLIREHARKFQLGLAEATVWLRR